MTIDERSKLQRNFNCRILRRPCRRPATIGSILLVLFTIVIFALPQLMSRWSPDSRWERHVNSEDRLAKFHLYNQSAATALQSIRSYLPFDSRLKTPLCTAPPAIMRSTTNQLLCVGVLSMPRSYSPIRYLSQSITSLLTRINVGRYCDSSIFDKSTTATATAGSVHIEVLNVDREPDRHWEAERLRDLISVHDLHAAKPNIVTSTAAAAAAAIGNGTDEDAAGSIVSSNGSRLANGTDSEVKRNEVVDYAVSLRRMHSLGCDFVTLLEDDIVADRRWLESIQLAIRQLEEKSSATDSVDWLVTKLYCTYGDWLAIITHPAVLWKSLVQTIITFIFILAALFGIQRLIIKFGSRQQSIVLFLALSFCTTFYFYLCYYATHKAPLGTGLVEYRQGFGLVAALYPRRHLLAFAEFLANHAKTSDKETLLPKDLLIERYCLQTGLREYVWEPSIFQHTGLFSSLGDKPWLQESVMNSIFQSFSFPADGLPITFDPKQWHWPAKYK